MMAGNCFAVAYGIIANGVYEWYRAQGVPVRLRESSHFRVVHGTPTGNGGDIVGVQHWHAWVELTYDDGDCLAIDLSNGKNVQIQREAFYRVGQLDESTVWRFTPAEARRLFRKYRHCGPWVPGWESIADGADESSTVPETAMKAKDLVVGEH